MVSMAMTIYITLPALITLKKVKYLQSTVTQLSRKAKPTFEALVAYAYTV